MPVPRMGLRAGKLPVLRPSMQATPRCRSLPQRLPHLPELPDLEELGAQERRVEVLTAIIKYSSMEYNLSGIGCNFPPQRQPQALIYILQRQCLLQLIVDLIYPGVLC